jgi:hypothetical protein
MSPQPPQRREKCFFTVGLLAALLFLSGGGNNNNGVDGCAFIPAIGVIAITSAPSMVVDACVFIPAIGLVAIVANNGGVSAGPPNMDHVKDLNGSNVK